MRVEQHRRPLLLNQSADMQDQPRLGLTGREAIEIDADMVGDHAFGRKALANRRVAQRIGDGQKESASLDQAAPEYRITHPG